MSYPAQNTSNPSQTSSDYNTMEREWRLISAIMAGVVEMRRCCGDHLPKFEGESSGEYQRRVTTAPWRPEFTDILQTLASKPFGRDVAIKGAAPDVIVGKLDDASGMRIGGLVDDIDGRGSSLTTFVREVFSKGVAKGAHAILVDYPPMPEKASRADEIALGARAHTGFRCPLRVSWRSTRKRRAPARSLPMSASRNAGRNETATERR